MSPEYPEFEGSDKVALCTTHQGVSDSFLYKSVKNAVIKRADKIDVWFESPAVELIQDPDSRIVVGVKVTRNGETRNVRALGGVVVATGGFECDTDMAQQYLGLKNYSVIGGQFNTGDGIKMCQKVGADLWHMNVFEGGFGTNSCGYAAENGGLAHQVVTLAHNPMNTGATVIVGTDGERFGNEAEIPRHGHLYENGIWENPHYPNAIYLIMDQTQYDLAVSEARSPMITRIPCFPPRRSRSWPRRPAASLRHSRIPSRASIPSPRAARITSITAAPITCVPSTARCITPCRCPA